MIATNRHRLGAAAILIAVLAGSFPLFEFFWHRSPLLDLSKQRGGWVGAVIVVIGSAIVHEALHGLSWRVLGRVPWRSISIRPCWRVMGFVAHLETSVPAPVYRAGVALPAVVLALPVLLLGFVTGFGLFVLWGLFFLLECYSDVAVLLAVWSVPAVAQVLDHPDRLGCRIVADSADVN